MNIELLKTLGNVKKYQKGEFVCVENEEGNTAYLLLQGRVEITLGSFTDSVMRIAELTPGAIFGEMSLLENKPRNASVVTRTDDVLVLEIEKSNFIIILKSDKEIAWNLLCTLLNRAKKLMKENKLRGFEAIAGYRKNMFYVQLKNMSQEQFESIVDKDEEYAFKLLKFLSSALAEMNDELMKRD